MTPRKNKNGEIVFTDYPDFRPNLTPREIFQLGSFGGTYWRPIYSSVTHKYYTRRHKKYQKCLKSIPPHKLTTKWEVYDKSINKYNVKVGSTLREWESKGWIHKSHPYGWVEWYCDFYHGKRGSDDVRQIGRWKRTAGANSRFRRRLINMIRDRKTKYDDESVSPKIRQTLQHWAYVLTSKDI